MRYYLTVLFFVVSRLSLAQFSDDFADGDFTSSPTWSGMTANFEINSLKQLHLLAPAADDTSYLSVPTTSLVTTWDFYVQMDFNPSSSNLTRVYLVSDNANLKGALNGYFVMLGNTTDEISLYRQTGTTITEILDGTDGLLNTATVGVRVKITRDGAGNWEVLRDITGGNTYTSEGIVNDVTYTTNAYFGVYCRYTSTRSELFYFDDLGDPYVDATSPEILSVTALSSTQLDVLFSEPVNTTSAEVAVNYSVNNGVGVPSTVVVDGTNSALVHLTLGSSLVNGTNYDLTVNNVEDLAANSIISPTVVPFFYFVPDVPSLNDVIITEVMADPDPQVGLPSAEYVEIYNRSDKYFDLSAWTISDASSSVTIAPYALAPGEYVLLCSSADAGLFSISNIAIAELPSLNNDGDAVVLKDDLGNLIDSIFFALSWYQNNVKDDGGWSLERKHNDAPCSDQSNWSSSVDASGGTPGQQNSIWTNVGDTTPPELIALDVMSDQLMVATFNEVLDTTSTATLVLNPGVSNFNWSFSSLKTLDIVPLTLNINVLYELQINGVTDCWGNTAGTISIKLGLPDSIEPQDIILNEIMFNPLTNGSDYVELYNRSQKILDLKEIYFANWDDDSIANYKSVTSTQRLFFPGEYVLLTEDTTDIQHDFDIYGIGSFIEMDLPTYPDDSGTVYVLSKDFGILDYFHYDGDYHYALITDENGKSLERITFEGAVNDPEIWHTAAENVQWGTPGYENSQLMYPEVNGTITITPEIFSPDNDGNNDILVISMEFLTNDNVVNIEIFDNRGRRVRELKDNYFVGNSAQVSWDGATDEGTKADIGTYVILVTALEADGSRKEYKLVCVVGGKL